MTVLHKMRLTLHRLGSHNTAILITRTEESPPTEDFIRRIFSTQCVPVLRNGPSSSSNVPSRHLIDLSLHPTYHPAAPYYHRIAHPKSSPKPSRLRGRVGAPHVISPSFQPLHPIPHPPPHHFTPHDPPPNLPSSPLPPHLKSFSGPSDHETGRPPRPRPPTPRVGSRAPLAPRSLHWRGPAGPAGTPTRSLGGPPPRA